MIFLTEAWTVEKSPAEFNLDPQKALLIPPRLDPQRQEVVMISVHTPDGTWASQTPIIRRNNLPLLPPQPQPLTYIPQLQGTFTIHFP